jgi:hypothetical protein
VCSHFIFLELLEEDMSIGVFISYNHQNGVIARALYQGLVALSPDLKVFIDHVGIEAGDDYENRLAKSISSSQWFLMICSGAPQPERDMGWCLYEAGQFRQKLVSEQNESAVKQRLVAIHDDKKRPKQLSQFQSIFISESDQSGRSLDLRPETADTTQFENTDIYKLFDQIIQKSQEKPLRDLTDPVVRNLLRVSSKEVIRAFIHERAEEKLPEVVLQPRISFKLPPTINEQPVPLTLDTKILSYESSLTNIFGINGHETTWAEIKVQSRNLDGTDALWVTDIERAAEQISLNRTPEQPSGLCVSKLDGKYYRVIFARYEPFRSKARVCYIVFIPTRPRRFEVKQRTSILLSCLILSIRFRQRILPYIYKIKEAPRNKKIDSITEFVAELNIVETEAQEFGISILDEEHDEAPLLLAMREGEAKAFVDFRIKEWSVSRNSILSAVRRVRSPESTNNQQEAIAEAEVIIAEELSKVSAVNGKFIEIITEELLYVEKIGIGTESWARARTIEAVENASREAKHDDQHNQQEQPNLLIREPRPAR